MSQSDLMRVNNLLHNPDDLINFVVVPARRVETYKTLNRQTVLLQY